MADCTYMFASQSPYPWITLECTRKKCHAPIELFHTHLECKMMTGNQNVWAKSGPMPVCVEAALIWPWRAGFLGSAYQFSSHNISEGVPVPVIIDGFQHFIIITTLVVCSPGHKTWTIYEFFGPVYMTVIQYMMLLTQANQCGSHIPAYQSVTFNMFML